MASAWICCASTLAASCWACDRARRGRTKCGPTTGWWVEGGWAAQGHAVQAACARCPDSLPCPPIPLLPTCMRASVTRGCSYTAACAGCSPPTASMSTLRPFCSTEAGTGQRAREQGSVHSTGMCAHTRAKNNRRPVPHDWQACSSQLRHFTPPALSTPPRVFRRTFHSGMLLEAQLMRSMRSSATTPCCCAKASTCSASSRVAKVTKP